MSNKLYCQSCSQPTEYTSVKPKFCSNCSLPYLSTTAVKRTPSPAPNARIETTAQEIEDGDDFDSPQPTAVPKLSKLEVELDGVEGSVRSGRQSFESVVASGLGVKPARVVKAKRVRPAKGAKGMSQEERESFLETFRKEAGSLRPR